MTDFNIYLKKGTQSIGDDPSRPLYCSTATVQLFVPKPIIKTVIKEVEKEVYIKEICNCWWCKLMRWIHGR